MTIHDANGRTAEREVGESLRQVDCVCGRRAESRVVACGDGRGVLVETVVWRGCERTWKRQWC